MSALESLALLSSEPLSRLDAKLLCPKILALSSDDLYGLIEVMHEAEPGCVSYVDDEWDFDLAALKPETLQKAHAFLDKCAAIAAGVVLATGGGGGAADAGAGDRRKRAIGDDGGAGDTKVRRPPFPFFFAGRRSRPPAVCLISFVSLSLSLSLAPPLSCLGQFTKVSW